jgi:hypothetical protein
VLFRWMVSRRTSVASSARYVTCTLGCSFTVTSSPPTSFSTRARALAPSATLGSPACAPCILHRALSANHGAQRVARGPLTGACLHTLPTSQHPHGRLRNFSPAEVTQIKRAQREARLKGQAPSEHVGYRREDQRCASRARMRVQCGR